MTNASPIPDERLNNSFTLKMNDVENDAVDELVRRWNRSKNKVVRYAVQQLLNEYYWEDDD